MGKVFYLFLFFIHLISHFVLTKTSVHGKIKSFLLLYSEVFSKKQILPQIGYFNYNEIHCQITPEIKNLTFKFETVNP